MKAKLVLSILLASIASIATGYLTGEPIIAFIVAGLAGVTAGKPTHSMIAAGLGVISWHLAGLLLIVGGYSSSTFELLSRIAGLPSVTFYIIPLTTGVLISVTLAYGLSSLFKR